jgi:hypothetical protein
MEPVNFQLIALSSYRRHSALFLGEISYFFVLGYLTMISVALGRRITEE